MKKMHIILCLALGLLVGSCFTSYILNVNGWKNLV